MSEAETGVVNRVLQVGKADSGRLFPIKVDPGHDAEGNETGPAALAINVQDQHTTMAFIMLHRHLWDGVLAEAVVLNEYTCVLPAGHGAIVGNGIGIGNTDQFFQGIITAVVSNTITVDSPWHYAFQAGDGVAIQTFAMNVDGSGTAVIFHAFPTPGVELDVYRISLAIVCDTEPDDSKFGDLAALTRGILIRKRIAGGETYMPMGNAKTNGQIKLLGTAAYADKAGGGKHSVSVFADLPQQLGVVVRLTGSDPADEQLELLVQDDLTGLDSFVGMMQGHVVIP